MTNAPSYHKVAFDRTKTYEPYRFKNTSKALEPIKDIYGGYLNIL